MNPGLPWPLLVVAKLFLSRLPVPYRVWKRLNLFVFGRMEDPDYALGVFRKHFEISSFGRKTGGFRALEIGPGDSLLSAVIARSYGAERCDLIDAGDFAHAPLANYLAMTAKLQADGRIGAPNLDGCQSVNDVLARCQAKYWTQGLQSLAHIKSGSVDFIWSHTVLQHVRLAEFREYMRELRRVIRADGVSSHLFDIRDFMGGALNHLRFPAGIWESAWMASSGFYSNRLRYSELLEIFESAGFDVELASVDRWLTLPTPVRKMSSPFREMDEENLGVSGFHVVLRPTAPACARPA